LNGAITGLWSLRFAPESIIMILFKVTPNGIGDKVMVNKRQSFTYVAACGSQQTSSQGANLTRAFLHCRKKEVAKTIQLSSYHKREYHLRRQLAIFQYGQLPNSINVNEELSIPS